MFCVHLWLRSCFFTISPSFRSPLPADVSHTCHNAHSHICTGKGIKCRNTLDLSRAFHMPQASAYTSSRQGLRTQDSPYPCAHFNGSSRTQPPAHGWHSIFPHSWLSHAKYASIIKLQSTLKNLFMPDSDIDSHGAGIGVRWSETGLNGI